MRHPARHSLISFLAAAGICLMASAFPVCTMAAPTGKSFESPEKAVDAFVGALRKNDLNALLAAFGKESEPLFKSEDPVSDQNERNRFVEYYDTQHDLVADANGEMMVLTVGTTGWPFPIPLVKTRKGWAFDTEVGLDEIINRRVGRNELQTLQACLATVDAQREYYSRDHDGDGILEYAQSYRSTPGLQNGLYWPVKEGEPQSPLGEIVAAAAAEGYTKGTGSAYHGYRYRLLNAQGPAAAGGAYDYLARDSQIGGFGLLAYPATYGDSGIMTFIVNHDGVVYQRDLGEQTEAASMKIARFDPVEGWTRVPEMDLASIPEE